MTLQPTATPTTKKLPSGGRHSGWLPVTSPQRTVLFARVTISNPAHAGSELQRPVQVARVKFGHRAAHLCATARLVLQQRVHGF